MKYVHHSRILSKPLAFEMFDGFGNYSDMECQMHKHDFLEINYVKQGHGTYYIGDQKYEFEKGDVFIINNCEYHGAINDSGDMILKVIVFTPEIIWSSSNELDQKYLKTFFEQKDQFNHHIQSSETVLTKKIESLFISIEHEWDEKQLGFQLIIKAQLLQMLAILYRAYESIESQSKEVLTIQDNYNKIAHIINYIDLNFHQKITLDQLAEMAHMNPNYFSTFFKKVMHISVIVYIRKKRLEYSKMLLKTTRSSVTNIAVTAGFSNVPYFNKAFREEYKMSPTEYRNISKT